MTKDEALKMALEALETNNKAWKHLADSGDAGFWEAEEQPFYELSVKAITAIKEALMSDTDGAQPEQETLAWEQFYPDIGKPQLAPPHPWEKFCDSNCVWTDHHPDCKLAQPKHERFLVATIGNWGRVEWADGVFPSLGEKMYSAPRTWVGLTDDEIFEIHKQVDSMQYLTFGHAIEAKLKEKNT